MCYVYLDVLLILLFLFFIRLQQDKIKALTNRILNCNNSHAELLESQRNRIEYKVDVRLLTHSSIQLLIGKTYIDLPDPELTLYIELSSAGLVGLDKNHKIIVLLEDFK